MTKSSCNPVFRLLIVKRIYHCFLNFIRIKKRYSYLGLVGVPSFFKNRTWAIIPQVKAKAANDSISASGFSLFAHDESGWKPFNISKRWTEITTVDHLILESPLKTTQAFQEPPSNLQFLHLFANRRQLFHCLPILMAFWKLNGNSILHNTGTIIQGLLSEQNRWGYVERSIALTVRSHKRIQKIPRKK